MNSSNIGMEKFCRNCDKWRNDAFELVESKRTFLGIVRQSLFPFYVERSIENRHSRSQSSSSTSFCEPIPFAKQIVTDIKDVDFVLVHGIDALTVDPHSPPVSKTYEELVSKLNELRKLDSFPPMIVANPDFVTLDGAEFHQKMPGTLGRLYERMGGEVIWMGKPGKLIYDYVLQEMQLKPEEIIAIGDSVEHDIKGATENGIDSIFITGGIHAKEVENEDGNGVSRSALEKLFEKHQMYPKYYMESFVA